MLRVGHLGLTGGIASAASAIWIRKRVLSSMDKSLDQSSLRGRIHQRGKYALAGIAFTGCATAVSGGLDSIERTLGFGHRTAGHSVPWVGSLYATARIAKESGFDVARDLCEKIGVPEVVDQVLDALEDLTSWVLDGGLAGAVTHWVGDIPTAGHGGTALQLLAPLVKTKTNLNLVLAADPLLNQGALYVGGVLAAVSWLVVGGYLLLPEQSIDRIETRISHFTKWLTEKVPGRERIYERAQSFYERVFMWVEKIASWIGASGPATTSLVSPTESTTATSITLQSAGNSPSPKKTALRDKNKPSQKAGTLSLQAEPPRKTSEVKTRQRKSLPTAQSKLEMG